MKGDEAAASRETSSRVSFVRTARKTIQLARPRVAESAMVVALGLAAAFLEGLTLLLFIPLIQSLGAAKAESNWLEGRFLALFAGLPFGSVTGAIVAMLCTAVAAKNAAAFASRWFGQRLEGRVAHRLRVKIFEQTLRSCIDYRPGHKRSDIVTTIAENSWKVATALGLLHRSVISACTVTFFLALMVLISIRLTLLSALFLIIGALIVRRVTNRAAEVGEAVVQENKAFGLHMWESIAALQLIRSFGAESREAYRFTTTSERLRHRLLRLDTLWATPGPLSDVAISLLIGTLIIVADSSAVGIASLAAFLSLLYRLQSPARELMQNRVAVESLNAAIGDVSSFLRETHEPFLPDGTIEAPPLSRSIDLSGVSFRYAETEPLVLRNISLRIPIGKTTAIVGRSGAGKSSLLSLLFRFYDPTEGEIRADGVPLRDFRVSSWRARLGLMSQEVQLFNDTVAANIRYGKPEASEEELKAAARVAHADGFIEELPAKYDTIIGDRGLRLSGGQRQRIALARAILRNPDVLMLDEATNALDPMAEQAFQEAFAEFSKRRTVVVIAHRLSTVLSADQVVVLEEGRVRQIGTPAQLIAQEGRFAEMYNLQQPGGATVARGETRAV